MNQVTIQAYKSIEWCKKKFNQCRNKYKEGISECLVSDDSEYVDETQVNDIDETINET